MSVRFFVRVTDVTGWLSDAEHLRLITRDCEVVVRQLTQTLGVDPHQKATLSISHVSSAQLEGKATGRLCMSLPVVLLSYIVLDTSIILCSP